MKTLIFIFLLCLFLPLGAQLRTRPNPLANVLRHEWHYQRHGRRWGLAIMIVRLQ